MTEEQSVQVERIGRYRILNPLGSGGMGDVYAGLDETLQRKVALKSLKADRRLNTESQERFLREARILSQLDHSSICRAYDYIKGDDSDWLVMELIDGWSLGDVIKKSPMGAAQTVKVAEQIAAVLVVTHAAGIVHRDLKPGNVMITPAGDAKVLDFGIARSGDAPAGLSPAALADAAAAADTVVDDEDATRTSTLFASTGDSDETRFHTRQHVSMGTLPYMSPEQARGETATSASDMFSFGLLLQEMITGRRAYPGGRDSTTLIERVQNGRTEPLTGSGDLVQLVRRLTAFAPSQRPTAVEAVERLHWIRDTPKRRIRRAAVAAGLVLVALASIKYTVDLRRERNVAIAAEADANRRRGQAEGLIGFMLDDLRTNLTKAGRLDLLEGVGAQAMKYFGSVPASTLTTEELSRRAQTLYQIGLVQQTQGKLKDARAAFDESLAVATLVAARDPSNGDWQLRLANAHFYSGDIRRRENDLTGAMREFEAYRDIAAALTQRDPNNLTWTLELSFGHGGVAAVQELQGDLEGAKKELEFALALKEQIAARDPKKVRPHDLGVAHNRLGVVLDKLGEMDAALDHFNADLAIREAQVTSAPTDQSIKRNLQIAMHFVGVALDERGDVAGAMAQHQAAYDVAAPLAASDPKNANWQRDLGSTARVLGDVLSEAGRTAEARTRYNQARAILGPIAAAAPTDVTRQQDMAKLELGSGSLDLSRGNAVGGRTAAAHIEQLLAALFQKKPDAETGRVLAAGRLLGATAAERAGDPKSAAAGLRESALATARSITGAKNKRVRAVEARALIALNRLDEARPLVTELVRLGYREPTLLREWKARGGVLDSAVVSKSR